MKKSIILHGHLAEKHPGVIEVEAETIAEAMQALSLYPELEYPPGSPWPVEIDGVQSKADLYEPTPVREIHVRPRMGGAGGNNGLLQVVIGATMIALAVTNPAFMGMSGFGQVMLGLNGALMVTGGLIQMMTPTPELGGGSSKASAILNGTGNTTKIGTPIPLAYGTQPLYGHYLSFNVDAKNWSGDDEDDPTADVVKVLPGDSTTVGVYPLPGATTGTAAKYKGVYAEFDKPSVPYALLMPIFESPTPSASNVPTSGWVV